MSLPTKLNVFDFDGTMVLTHESEPGQVLYEQLTGKPWMVPNHPTAVAHGFDPKFRRTGWWGRPETLQPPLMPRPIPTEFRLASVYDAYLRCKADPEALNVLVTGRHSKIGPLVKEVLDELGYHLDEYHYKGGYPMVKHPKYPKDNNTPDFKVHAVVDHLIKPHMKQVELWEDREDIIELFNGRMKDAIREYHPQIERLSVNDVTNNKAYHHALTACHLHVSLKVNKG